MVSRAQREADRVIPAEEREKVERYAKKRATKLGFVWDEISEAHRRGIMETIWAELNWREV